MSARWWYLPLVVAAACDLALVGRYEASPGLAVDRAVLRTVEGNGCEQAVVIRGSGTDQLFVIDTWRQPDGIVSGTARADFTPGAGLTTQSRASIATGGEVDLSMVHAPVPAAQSSLLVGRYQQQVGAAASWLSGPCLPFANPFQSHLHRVGSLPADGTDFTVYRGEVRYLRGSFQLFSDALVWMGVRPDGRMGFEVVRQSAAQAHSQPVTVATLFQYPDSHISQAFAHKAASVRADFYTREYHSVLGTMSGLVTAGYVSVSARRPAAAPAATPLARRRPH